MTRWLMAAFIAALFAAMPAFATTDPIAEAEVVAPDGRASDVVQIIAVVEMLAETDPPRAKALLETYIRALAKTCVGDRPEPADLAKLKALATKLGLADSDLTLLGSCDQAGVPGASQIYTAVYEAEGLRYEFLHCGPDPAGKWDIVITGAMSGDGTLRLAPWVDSATNFEGQWTAAMAMQGMTINMSGWATLSLDGDKPQFTIETSTATGTGEGGSATRNPDNEVEAVLTIEDGTCELSDPQR